MGETLRQPLAPGLEEVESTASGETLAHKILSTGFFRASVRTQALREVLELIEYEKFEADCPDLFGMPICGADSLRAKVKAMMAAPSGDS